MSGSNLLQQWVSEFCAPVVVTLATAEAEKMCLQNGLLLHELLSCFGHLDGINSVIRVGNQVFSIPDAHIRFERVTEVKNKTTENVEELLRNTFTPFDMNRLPNSVPELKATPPTAWTHTAEQIVSRSLSFSEYEMLSHPMIVLTVVSTADADPLAAMQELTSIHHTPTCFSNGQYDNTIQRVFVLLDDAGDKHKDPLTIMRSLNAHFPPTSTKLVVINSFPPTSLNMQQPDMWSRFLIPKYFPQNCPSLDLAKLPVHPATNKAVLGTRLSVEDFMKLREFCIWMYNEQIIPGLEKRLAFLHRQVNDARKGMKNLWKGLFRKPRDEADSVNGGVKYRVDKIESQTLVLADLSFMIRDFETALSNYKLVRDEFKADKSLVHLAHVYLMIAMCQLRTEPHKYKEIFSQLENVSQCLVAGLEVGHAYSYFAILSAELYCAHHHGRAPLEAARILLQASGNLSKYPVLSSLLIERAALYFMQANQVRKYVLHSVLAGNRVYRCGASPAQHAAVCFTASMMLLEKGQWGDLKVKLFRSLANDLKAGGRERAQRSLLFLLKMLVSILDDSADIGNHGSLFDAVNVLNEICRDGPWGHVQIKEGWFDMLTRDVVLGSLPVSPLNIFEGDASKSNIEVTGLSLPRIDMQTVEILEPINGPNYKYSSSSTYNNTTERDLLHCLLDVEKKWVRTDSSNPEALTLEELWIKAENEFHQKQEMKSTDLFGNGNLKLPLGEKLIVKMQLSNKLPVDLQLSRMKLMIGNNMDFHVQDMKFTMNAEQTSEITLEASPKQKGRYTVSHLCWNLSDHLSVVQPIHKVGPLLQKSMQQRAENERGHDTSLEFEVIDANPLLQLQFEGLSPEVLQGQLLKSNLLIKNVGAAPATEIFIKLSQPSFVFYLKNPLTEENGKILNFYGKSSTLVYLEGVEILPGQEIRLESWLRVTKPGLQRVSLLATYHAPTNLSESTKAPFVRTSFLSIQTRGLPSLGVSLKLASKSSSSKVCTLVTEVTNYLRYLGSSNPEDVRISSVGQVELPNLDDEFMEIDGNCVKVVGMWMIGGGEPYSFVPNKAASGGIYASPLERVAQCFPIQVYPAKSKLAKESWLIPLSQTYDDSFMTSAQIHLHKVIEQFLCIWYADHDFSLRLQEARITVQMAEDEANAAGPRSIAEVRRDRQKQLALKALNNVSEDWDTVDMDGEKGSANLFVPKTVSDISKLELKKNCVNIVTVWVCRWADKIRWGMHHAPHVGLHHTEANPITNIHISLNHDKSVTVDAASSSSAIQQKVPVQVTVRSLSYQPILLQVRVAKDYKEKEDDSMLQRVVCKGFNWVGKVSYDDILLPAQQEVVLDFEALVVETGVFDLNRFQIHAKYAKAPTSLSPPTYRALPGQSLLYVHHAK